MSGWWTVAPVALPLAAAALAFALVGQRSAQRVIATLTALALVPLSVALLMRVSQLGIQTAQLGDWPAPFGIAFVADHFSAIMVVITAIMAAATAIYALADIDPARESLQYHPLFLVLVAGVNGAFLTGDLFNLYVWFEVLLISSFALLTLGNLRNQLEGGLKYVAVNLVSSLLFLASIGIVYGLTGTLNFADLAVALRDAPAGLVTVVAMLFLVAFGIKAAIFPLFFWLPASYHTPPIAISAFFAGMLTKVGVYALIRVFTLLFTHDVAWTHGVLAWLAALTMVIGVLGAAAQNEVHKILSFHIVSQIGYILMGLAIFTPLALAAAVFYLAHNIFAKANLFFIAGMMRRAGGSFDLGRLGGLYKTHLWLALLFIVSAFGLAGFPPLSGFWAKALVVLASLDAGNAWLAATALGVGLLTLYSMTKIWQGAFWAPAPTERAAGESASWPLVVPAVVLAGLTVVLGLASEPFIALANAAAAELMNPNLYIEAVLNGSLGMEVAP